MPVFYFPVEGLELTQPWNIGSVTVYPADSPPPVLLPALRQAQANSPAQAFAALLEAKDPPSKRALIEVPAQSKEIAWTTASIALDVLRVYQHVGNEWLRVTEFGLPGQVRSFTVVYGQVQDDERVGLGVWAPGDATGWSFDDEQHKAWTQSKAFQFVASAVGQDDTNEGQRRALIGVELLSLAILELRPAAVVLNVVAALEALLLEERPSSQTYTLAQRGAYFGCGRYENSLCGRERDTCPFLGLDPSKESERRQLKQSIERTRSEPGWRCAEFLRIIDWYEDRSGIVHGKATRVPDRTASRAEFWVMRWHIEAILEWIADHPDDPVGDLERAIRALPSPPDWEAIIAAERAAEEASGASYLPLKKSVAGDG